MNALENLLKNFREISRISQNGISGSARLDAMTLAEIRNIADTAIQEHKASEQGEELRSELFSDIVRRSAQALEKPLEGNGSSWHDIPECIAALRAELAQVKGERDLYREFISDLRETLELHESHWSYHIHKDLKHLDDDLAAALKRGQA